MFELSSTVQNFVDPAVIAEYERLDNTADIVRAVQVVPSGDVAHKELLLDKAQNTELFQEIFVHVWALGSVCCTQVIPSVDVAHKEVLVADVAQNTVPFHANPPQLIDAGK